MRTARIAGGNAARRAAAVSARIGVARAPGSSGRIDERDGHREQPFGSIDRKRSHQHRVDQTDRRGCRANRQSQRQDSGDADRSPLVELAPAEHDVRHERIEQRQAALVAKRIHRVRDAAGSHQDFPPTGPGVMVSASWRFRGQVQMRLQFRLQIAVGPAPPERRPAATAPLAEGGRSIRHAALRARRCGRRSPRRRTRPAR